MPTSVCDTAGTDYRLFEVLYLELSDFIVAPAPSLIESVILDSTTASSVCSPHMNSPCSKLRRPFQC